MKQFIKGVIPCFRRWTRKRYGIFSSLGREVKIGVLSVAMSIIASTHHTIMAQTADTVVNASVEQVTVEIWKIPLRGATAPLSTVYDRSKATSEPNRTIESLLSVDPAIDLRQRGASGVQADISLWGGSTDQTKLTLNGIDFTDARTGHQTHSLPLDPETVSRIEIRDQSTSMGAFAGIVNYITSPISPEYLRFEADGGNFGYGYCSLSGATTTGRMSIVGQASYRRSSGYTDNTDFDKVNIYTNMRYRNRGWFVEAQGGYQTNRFGAMGFYSLAYPNQAEQTRTAIASLYAALRTGSIKWWASAGYRYNTDRFELFRSMTNAPTWYTSHNYHQTDNLTAEVGAERRWRGGTTSAGVDYALNHIYSTVLGDEMAVKRKAAGYTDIYYTKAKLRQTTNLWLRHSINVGLFGVDGSVNVSDTDYGTLAMWSCAATCKPDQRTSIGVSATASMRQPTFTDLYYTTATHTGNADLGAERATTIRLTATRSFGTDSQTEAGITTFYRAGRDIIDWVKLTEESKWQSEQITRLGTAGVSLRLQHRFRRGVFESVSAGYAYIHTDLDSRGYISKYALDYLRNKLSATATLRLPLGLSLALRGTLCDRNGNYALVDGNALSYRPYFLADCRLSRTWRRVSVNIDCTNIANTAYFDFGGVYGPQRWLTAGLTVTL